jgi:steroid delta-isomerase-like uncharacterized protein
MKSLMGIFIFLFGITFLISTGCTVQEERTYTDAELQSLMDGSTQLWNGGDIELINTLYAEDCVRHNADVGESNGPDGVKEFVEWVYNAYPDFKVTFDEPMKFKEGIVMLFKATGTNDGSLNENMPATGKEVSFTGVSVFKIENGKYKEVWVYYNQLPIYRQMGYELELEGGGGDDNDAEDDD